MPTRVRKSSLSAPSSAARTERRRLPISEKRRLVELTLQKGASVRTVAREHGVNRYSLYQWRSLYAAGELVGDAPAALRFLPVSLSTPLVGDRESRNGESSRVEVVLPSGAMLRIESRAIDASLVCALLAQVQR